MKYGDLFDHKLHCGSASIERVDHAYVDVSCGCADASIILLERLSCGKTILINHEERSVHIRLSILETNANVQACFITEQYPDSLNGLISADIHGKWVCLSLILARTNAVEMSVSHTVIANRFDDSSITP